MLRLYLDTESAFTHKVRQELEELVIAHETIKVGPDTGLPDELSEQELPLLSDGHENWRTREEITAFLNDLRRDVEFSRGMTADACYVDPDNPERCL